MFNEESYPCRVKIWFKTGLVMTKHFKDKDEAFGFISIYHSNISKWEKLDNGWEKVDGAITISSGC